MRTVNDWIRRNIWFGLAFVMISWHVWQLRPGSDREGLIGHDQGVSTILLILSSVFLADRPSWRAKRFTACFACVWLLWWLGRIVASFLPDVDKLWLSSVLCMLSIIIPAAVLALEMRSTRNEI